MIDTESQRKSIRELLGVNCDHAIHGIAHTIAVPDFHAVSLGELVELMYVATSTDDLRLQCLIQVRLEQAVPGSVCPHPTDGLVARKRALIGQLYVDEITHGRTPDFIPRFFEIVK